MYPDGRSEHHNGKIMTAYLKIENPGVAPPESFTLLGASTKRQAGSATIGKFGSGNKHGVAVLLRNRLAPIVFGGSLKLEFGTRKQGVDTGNAKHEFERVVVKYGGKDAQGVNRSSTEDLGFVLEYGATDWLGVDLALREFVSNAIDRAIEEGQYAFSRKWCDVHGMPVKDTPEFTQFGKELAAYQLTATDYRNVVIEVVNESQVRAKAGHTRVFVPLNTEVLEFYNNLGKWFLHFSEPELLNATILPKNNRNLGNRSTAVVYRRGVRVREFQTTDTPSLFDYNLENLELDESRKVDDWNVQYSAAQALSSANQNVLGRLWQSFLDGTAYWEHLFQSYGLDVPLYSSAHKENWVKSFEQVAGDNAVMATGAGGDLAARKGYKVIAVPEAFMKAAERAGVRTPAVVLSQDNREGRDIFDSTPDAEAAVDFAWNLVEKYNLTNGRSRPHVKTFRKIMESGSQTLGLYRDGTVYINQDIASNGSLVLGWHGLSQQLLVTALEEVSHHVTGATDNSRDFQDFMLNLIVYMAREMSGVE